MKKNAFHVKGVGNSQSNGQIGPDDCPLLRPLIHRGTAVVKFQTIFFSIENDAKSNEKCSNRVEKETRGKSEKETREEADRELRR